MDLKEKLLNKLYEEENYHQNTIASENRKDIKDVIKKELKAVRKLIAELKGCRVEKLVSLQTAEVDLIKKFIDDIEEIYNGKDMGDMQTVCELTSEKYYDLLFNKYGVNYE